MSQNEEEQTLRSRREKLKMLAAAPLIFTLPSGAALASSSSSCVDDYSNILEIKNVTQEDDVLQGKINGKDYIFSHNQGDYYSSQDGQQYVFIQKPGNTGSLVTLSCWASLHPSQNFQ